MSRIILLATAASVLLAGAAPAAAPQFDTPAKVAYLFDLNSGAVLYAKSPDVRMPPASMAKMMTTEVAFELIDKGQLPPRRCARSGPRPGRNGIAGLDHVPQPGRAGQRR